MEIKNLGCMNGWRENPPEYEKHLDAIRHGEKHEMTGRQLGRCWHETTCHTCGIRFDADSSD